MIDKRCNVFCGKLLRYKSIMLSVDVQIIELLHDGASSTFFAVLRCSERDKLRENYLLDDISWHTNSEAREA